MVGGTVAAAGYMRRCPAVALAVLLVSAVASRARAQEMAVPVEVQFSLFYRILTYDRGLPAVAGNDLVLCVLYQSEVRASSVAKDAALRQRPPRGYGIAMRMAAIDLDGSTDFRSAVMANGCDVLYVTPLRAIRLAAIVEVSRERRVLTLTGVPEYVTRGLAVGIGANDDRPEILVNLTAATAEGAVFSAQLLRLARVR